MDFIAKTLYGLEHILAEELTCLGASGIKIMNRAVFFNGDQELLYKVNYCSRTALSILKPVADFRIRSKDDLYKGGMKVEWDKYMFPDDTFAIVSVVNSPQFTHTGYAGLVLKDAVADFFRKKYGKRPSVDTKNPAITINLHISNDIVTISLDSTVIPLFKRGYRKSNPVAPINEVLAAGIIMLSGWQSGMTFIDPMCGSGTFLIEAGLIATNTSPGKFRKYFGFQRWKDYDELLFSDVKSKAEPVAMTTGTKILGSDLSEDAIKMAKENVINAGLDEVISLEVADFRDIKGDGKDNWLFLNPPYGERLKPDDSEELYSKIGTTLKHSFPGSTAWVITSNKELLKRVGLRHSEKHTLYNGALECMLVRYDMYSGTKKKNKD